MSSRLSSGDRIVCKIKDGKILNVYEDDIGERNIFDIVVKYNDGFLVYVSQNIFLKNSIYISKDNYKRYKVDKRFIDSYVYFITDHNIVSIYSLLDGLCCTDCGEFYSMAAPNRENEVFICWMCTNYPFYG
jgi:hypothetical protein